MQSKQQFYCYATIVMPWDFGYDGYISIVFRFGSPWWLVPDVRAPASRSGHGIAGSGLPTDLPLEELPRPAALHAGLQAMWQWTCARLRNRHNACTRSVTLRRRSGSSRAPSPTAHERKHAHAKDLSHAHVLCTGKRAWQIHKVNHERRRR
jgi:hypothetical protein